MNKVTPGVTPGVTLDAGQLVTATTTPNATDALPQVTKAPPRQLPKPLADFKVYVESKWCYHPAALETAELVSVQAKVAYQCHMKVLFEERKVKWKKEPATWHNETKLFSKTLGRYFEDTTRGGQTVNNMWDYEISIPESDAAKTDQSLPDCNHLSRCHKCEGKGLLTCDLYTCLGKGWATCANCDGKGYTRIGVQPMTCTQCSNGKVTCYKCKGTGKMHCPECKGYGGFFHSATLKVKWFSSKTTNYYQNSFLPKNKIKKAQRTRFWSNTQEPWSKESSIYQFLQSLNCNEANEGIQLKSDLQKQYQEKLLRPNEKSDRKMRRLVCEVERLDFEEVQYTLDDNYLNKRESKLGNKFRFCRYPARGNALVIYENDYPLNCCGCFGERCACYSCCCTIL